MLKIITLHTINEVFKQAQSPVYANAKMVYISCLIHHFGALEPSESNAMEFALSVDEVQLPRYAASFDELHRAGLVRIEKDEVVFINLWGQHIDRTLLTAENDSEGSFHKITKFSEQLYGNTSLEEFIRRAYKLSEHQYNMALDEFCAEQDATQRVYHHIREVYGHFKNWCKYNLDKPTHTSAKSTGKLLGDD